MRWYGWDLAEQAELWLNAMMMIQNLAEQTGLQLGVMMMFADCLFGYAWIMRFIDMRYEWMWSKSVARQGSCRTLVMNLAHVYHIIFAFPLLSLHCWSTTTHPADVTSCMSLCNHSHMMQSPLLHWTSLAYLIDIWCTIHMFTVPLLVTSYTLPWPNQSHIIAPCSQALTIALLWMSLVLAFLFTICI